MAARKRKSEKAPPRPGVGMPRGARMTLQGVTLGGRPIDAVVSVARMRVRSAPTRERRRRDAHLVVPASWGTRFLREAERELAERRAREAGQGTAPAVVGTITPTPRRGRGKAA